jgi:hypothetical protein
MADNPEAQLRDLLGSLVAVIANIDLDLPDAVQRLTKSAPMDGQLVDSICDVALAGIEDGWLLPAERGGIRFGRIAADLSGFSVDAVLSSGSGPRHRHPRGEIDLVFALSGDPRFDGHTAGWVVYPPGSEHVPAVTGGEMLILYFLPGGAIEWVTDDGAKSPQ